MLMLQKSETREYYLRGTLSRGRQVLREHKPVDTNISSLFMNSGRMDAPSSV